jgi:S1-C subfamily serine protease
MNEWSQQPQTPQPPTSLPPEQMPAGRAQVVLLVAVVTVVVLTVAMVTAEVFMLSRATTHSQGLLPARSLPGSAPAAAAAPSGSGQGVVDIYTKLGDQGEAGAGTGIVLSSDGLVLTNNHVVAGATAVKAVDPGSGQSYPATVLGYDRTGDLAVVKLSGATGLGVAAIGDSATVSPGDTVTAIGDAYGHGGTPATATGTVTALDQAVTANDAASGTSERLTGLIAVNAPIQPGDSGGPLTDASGKVVGIDTAAETGTSSGDTLGGFAIPINQAMTTAKQIAGGQASSTVHIGHTAFLGIQTSGQTADGIPVVSVVPDTPADGAGLGDGDVLQTVDGQTVGSTDALYTLLDQHHPGDRLSIGWTDASGQAHTATVTAGDGPVG